MPRVSITIPGKNSQPYRFKLDREKVSIGRSAENDIVVDCASVSGSHCTMERVPGGYLLRDRKSTNGIRLDDKFMSVIDLQNNADVRIGDVKFGYTLSKEELDELDLEEFLPHQESSDDYVERKSHMVEDRSAKRKSNLVTASPRRSVAAAPALASASQGPGFFYGVCLLLVGILAFYAGLNSSYQEKQSKAGRKGEISLFQDIKDGRSALPKVDETSGAQ